MVRKEEFDKLKVLVEEQWLEVDDTEDDYGTDAAYQLEIVFDWLLFKDFKANTCYDEFVKYAEEHPYFFTESLNSQILKTAASVASAFSGQNKSELILLAKLDMLLKSILEPK